MGLPGLIATPLKHFLKLSLFISSGIKSNFPAEMAPEVTIISVSEFINFFRIFLSLSGSLSFIIPPSIILILLGDVISSSYQEAQNILGIFSQESVSVGDLFAGAIFPGLILVSFYIIYILYIANFKPDLIPEKKFEKKFNLKEIILSLYSPLFLILIVLGSIILGVATPTEASSFGAIGSALLALINKNFNKLFEEKESIAENLNIDLNKRPEELSSEMFYKIAVQYEKLSN